MLGDALGRGLLLLLGDALGRGLLLLLGDALGRGLLLLLGEGLGCAVPTAFDGGTTTPAHITPTAVYNAMAVRFIGGSLSAWGGGLKASRLF